MTAETIIAFACETARNKHASPHANAAHGRLIEAAIKNPPVAFALFPSADNFTDAREYLEALAHAFDEIAHNLAVEANANATAHISTKDRTAIFSDSLGDSGLLSDLSEAAERLREDALEVA